MPLLLLIRATNNIPASGFPLLSTTDMRSICLECPALREHIKRDITLRLKALSGFPKDGHERPNDWHVSHEGFDPLEFLVKH